MLQPTVYFFTICPLLKQTWNVITSCSQILREAKRPEEKPQTSGLHLSSAWNLLGFVTINVSLLRCENKTWCHRMTRSTLYFSKLVFFWWTHNPHIGKTIMFYQRGPKPEILFVLISIDNQQDVYWFKCVYFLVPFFKNAC